MSGVRSYRHVSKEDRRRIENKTLEGVSAKNIAEALELNYQTVYKIVKRFKELNTTAVRPRGGDRRSKLSSEQKLELLTWVNNNCLLRLSDLTAMVQEKFSIGVSSSAIERILLGFHYTIKSLVPAPEFKNDETTLEKRFDYANRFRMLEQNINDKNFIFCDEVGFSVCTRQKKKRSRNGISTYVSVAMPRRRNISIFAAANRYGLIYHKIHDRVVNGKDFMACLVDIKRMCDEKEIANPVFILDNAKIHCFSCLQSVIQSLNLNLFYLPPFSPYLNIIQNVFLVWKNLVIKSECRSEVELRRIMNLKFLEITAGHCGSFYHQMEGHLMQSERREPII